MYIALYLVDFTIKRCSHWSGTELSVWLRCSQPYLRGCEISDFCVCVLLWLMITSGLWHLGCYLHWRKLSSVSPVVTRDWKNANTVMWERLKLLGWCWTAADCSASFGGKFDWGKSYAVFHPFNSFNSLVSKEYFRFWHL